MNYLKPEIASGVIETRVTCSNNYCPFAYCGKGYSSK